MAVICVSPILDYDVGVIFKNGNDFLTGWNHLAQQNSALSLVDHLLGQPNEVLQFGPQNEVTAGKDHVFGHGNGLACDQQQVLVKLSALLLSLCVQDAKGSPLGTPGVVGKSGANLTATDLHFPSEDANTVVE